MIEEEIIESEWEEDVDVAIEKAIRRATRTGEVKRSLREIIASITAEQSTTRTPTRGDEEKSS